MLAGAVQQVTGFADTRLGITGDYGQDYAGLRQDYGDSALNSYAGEQISALSP